MTDRSGSVKNASLSIVDELYFFDLIWLKHTWKRQDIEDLINGNRSREHRIGWNVHFLFLTNNLLLQECPLVCHRHQRDVLHQHWYLFCSVIQNSSKVDNRCFHLQIGETNLTYKFDSFSIRMISIDNIDFSIDEAWSLIDFEIGIKGNLDLWSCSWLQGMAFLTDSKWRR